MKISSIRPPGENYNAISVGKMLPQKTITLTIDDYDTSSQFYSCTQKYV